jgi:hypothetical protein
MLPFFSEETDWILAAEKFSLKNVPSASESLSSVIPQLILSRVSSINSRLIQSDERKARELAELSDKRMKMVRERANIVFERDSILLSTAGTMVKNQKMSDVKKRLTDKEKEIAALNKKIALKQQEPPREPVTMHIKLWKSENDLYTRASDVSLLKSLANDKISALITGTIEDIAGYAFISATIETGIDGMKPLTVSDAGPYDEIDTIVTNLSMKLLPDLSRRLPVSVTIKTVPENARVFIDNRLVESTGEPVSVFMGEHAINVSADGYETAYRTYNFDNARSFEMTVNLVKQPLVTVSFDTTKSGAPIFFHTQYAGQTPFTAELPAFPTIGESSSGDLQTFFIFQPDENEINKPLHATIPTNSTNTKKTIEDQRKVFYWSLGALYISLPVSMLTYGVSINKYNAYQDGKLERSEAMVNEVNNWTRSAVISRYVSIGLGINVAIQLFRYILAADQATPKYAKEDIQ